MSTKSREKHRTISLGHVQDTKGVSAIWEVKKQDGRNFPLPKYVVRGRWMEKKEILAL